MSTSFRTNLKGITLCLPVGDQITSLTMSGQQMAVMVLTTAEGEILITDVSVIRYA